VTDFKETKSLIKGRTRPPLKNEGFCEYDVNQFGYKEFGEKYKEDASKEAKALIKDIEIKLKEKNIKYKTTFHENGFCPWIRVWFDKDIEKYSDGAIKKYKIKFWKDVYSKINKPLNKIKMDMSVASGNFQAVTEIGKKHWKHNTTEVILSESDGILIPINKEVMNEFEDSIKKEKQENNVVLCKGNISKIKSEDIIGLFNKYYSQGTRHFFIVAIAGYFHRYSIDCDSAWNIIKPIILKFKDDDVLEREHQFKATFRKRRNEVACKSFIEENIAGYDDELTIQIYNDIKKAICLDDYKNIENIDDLKNKVLMFLATKQSDKGTEAIVQYIEKNNHIKTTMDDIKSEIWFYQDGVYKPNGASKIKEITRNILEDAFTPQILNKIIAKIEADTFIEADGFFNAKYIDEVPVLNGVLNIKTRELNNFTPDKIFFNKLPIEYDENAVCPNIDIFFKSILKEEDASKVLEELFGYCLYKDHFIEQAVMFVGDGRNGKSKTISLLKAFLGGENCCSVSLSQLNSQSTSVCELHGKLANLAGDLSPTSLKDTGLFKEVVGRDTIGAKRKYLRDLFFQNYSKQVFACNELPKVYDTSNGFWERWILFDFPYTFIDKSEYEKLSKEDRLNKKIRDVDIILKITTQEELSGLLNKALNGLQRLLDNKKFSYNRAVDDVKNMWIRKSDSFSSFCIDYVEYDYECFTPKKTIRKMFSDYCRFHKIKGASDIAIKTRLESDLGITDSRVNLETFGMNFNEHCWEGLKLKAGIYFQKIDENITLCQGCQGFSENPRKKNFQGFCKNPDIPDNLVENIQKTKPISCFNYGGEQK